MADFGKNLWAPWRMEYIEGLQEAGGGACFLCKYRDEPVHDARNLVVHRSATTLLVLNRFPYSSGHLLIAPLVHAAAPEDVPDAVLCDLTLRIRDAKRVLQAALKPDGFNIGLNLGRCAGAGLPDHLHWHVVPRWNGDTNFMPVLGDVKVMPQMLERVRELYLEAAARLGLGSESRVPGTA
jgi:ATP adenylyltransferase